MLPFDVTMEGFIRRENIALYRRLLAHPTVAENEARHAELLRLLAVEVAKDEGIEREDPLRIFGSSDPAINTGLDRVFNARSATDGIEN